MLEERAKRPRSQTAPRHLVGRRLCAQAREDDFHQCTHAAFPLQEAQLKWAALLNEQSVPLTTIPKTMRAAAIDRFGEAEALTLHTLPVPVPESDEVLIKIDTAGVGAWDIAMR